MRRQRLRTCAALVVNVLLACACTATAAAASASVGARVDTLYVVRRGWHTDVGFAVSELDSTLSTVVERFPGVQYLFFSFGDRHYLLARDHGVPTLLGALWPGPGLVLATALGASPSAAFGAGHVLRISVSSQQSAAAQRFIAHSMTAAAALPGPYPGSLYFGALARYSAAHTCNTWSVEVMEAAGLPTRAGGVVFANQAWRRALRLTANSR